MEKLIFFSHNKSKIKEILESFKKTKIKILTLNDFPNTDVPEENGISFEENAKIKSEFGYNHFGLPCFADDSGICIDALNNLPGIKSNRFQKENGGYEKTFKLIIDKAKVTKKFNAYFKTVISLTTDISTIYFSGSISGKISASPLGSLGFGYDPIFIPRGSIKTFAQMTSVEKNKLSHRSAAIKKLKNFLK